MSRIISVISLCLIGVILSLLVVAVVSATPLRHAVQLTPVIIALVAIVRRADWGKYAALPLFIFWFVLMLFIWLYLLGIAQVLSGRFTPAEIICTVVIGVCCVCGVVASLRGPLLVSRTSSVLLFIVFAAFQVAAMWLSFRPSISHH